MWFAPPTDPVGAAVKIMITHPQHHQASKTRQASGRINLRGLMIHHDDDHDDNDDDDADDADGTYRGISSLSNK